MKWWKKLLIWLVALGVIMFIVKTLTATIKAFFIFTGWTVVIVAALVLVWLGVRKVRKVVRLKRIKQEETQEE